MKVKPIKTNDMTSAAFVSQPTHPNLSPLARDSILESCEHGTVRLSDKNRT